MQTLATARDPHRKYGVDFSHYSRDELEAMRRATESVLDALDDYYADRNARIDAWLVVTLAGAGLALADAGRCRLVAAERERAPGRWVDVLSLEVDGRAVGEPLRLVFEFGVAAGRRA